MPTPVTLPLREQTTANQVGTILGIVGMSITAMGFAMRDREELESAIPTEGKRLPGEALIAAENTFIKAFARLDTILEDGSRWGSNFQDKLEADYHKAYAENIAFLTAQRKSAEEISSPHARLNPQLAKLKSGDWVVMTGNDPGAADAIIGIGPTPDAAIQAFDDAFHGILSPYTEEWMKKHGIETNEIKPLDTNNGNATQDPPPGGEDGQGNSPDAGS